MKIKILIAAISIAAVALTGCAAGDTQGAGKTMQPLYSVPGDADMPPMDDDHDPVNNDFDPMDGMDTMEAGEYEVYSMEGAHIVFNLPTAVDSPEVAAIEDYRQAAKIGTLTYVIADVDNREGTDSVNMYGISVFDKDGNEYEFKTVDMALYDWSPEWTADDQYFYADGTEMSEQEYWRIDEMAWGLEENLTDYVKASGRGEMILVYEGDDLPDEFTRVAVLPNGAFEETEAFPTDM